MKLSPSFPALLRFVVLVVLLNFKGTVAGERLAGVAATCG